jgi:hypothetical protein
MGVGCAEVGRKFMVIEGLDEAQSVEVPTHYKNPK